MDPPLTPYNIAKYGREEADFPGSDSSLRRENRYFPNVRILQTGRTVRSCGPGESQISVKRGEVP